MVTIDSTHDKFLSEFYENDKRVIPALKKTRNKLIALIAKPSSVEVRLCRQDKLTGVNEQIRLLKQKKKNYFLANSNNIFEYFEAKKNISDDPPPTTADKTTNKNKIIMQFFKLDPTPETSPLDESGGGAPQSAGEPSTQIGLFGKRPNFVVASDQYSKNITNEYLSNLDDTFIDLERYIRKTDLCTFCHTGTLIPVEDEGVLMCTKPGCARMTPYLIENEKPSYKDPPKELCFYVYHRINHFKEIIAQIQGKQTTHIPQEVIDNIRKQVKKERIVLKQLSNAQARIIIKKLGYNKYYDHVTFIKTKFGIKPPIIPTHIEEQLYIYFINIQPAYAKACPVWRTNFLHYCYTGYKLCELMGLTQYLPLFTLLKDPVKILEQDVIWEKMCKIMNWRFIHTVQL